MADPIITFGEAKLTEGKWRIEAQPHVRIKLKALFPSFKSRGDVLFAAHSEVFSEEFEWFLTRYPLVVSDGDLFVLRTASAQFKEKKAKAFRIVSGSEPVVLSQPKPLAYELRPYQAQAVAVARNFQGLLLADALGLGKTVSAIGFMNEEGGCPAMVVCPVHLMEQWMREIQKFAPHLVVHKTRVGAYTLPSHDVLIMPYTRLVNWRNRLGIYRTVIFEEAHELRHDTSQKYDAALAVRNRATWVMALTGTPVYNFGIEAFNILDIIMPGALGDRDQFTREWCSWAGKSVKNPIALGAFLREQHLMMRRTREEVGRELPPVNVVTHALEFDASILDSFKDEALQLARTILTEGINFAAKGQAARELSMKMYELTGIAKSAYVANFVADMVENGESLILYAWHREVWAVVEHIFKARGVRYAMYTGTESSVQKELSKSRFIAGEVDVLCMSIKSGVGIDGLQMRTNLCVFGELHWSPQQLNQDIGRLARDGQEEVVTAVYLVADGGCDPSMAELLGLKRDQNSGVVDLTLASQTDDDMAGVQESRAAILAKSLLGIT